jgi:hypothetical protein
MFVTRKKNSASRVDLPDKNTDVEIVNLKRKHSGNMTRVVRKQRYSTDHRLFNILSNKHFDATLSSSRAGEEFTASIGRLFYDQEISIDN